MKDQIAIIINFNYNSYYFKGIILFGSKKGNYLTAIMNNVDVSLDDFLKKIGFEQFLNILPSISLKKVILSYKLDNKKNMIFKCSIMEKNSVTISSEEFSLKIFQKFSLQALPFIGNILNENDVIKFNEIKANYKNKIQFSMENELEIQGMAIPLNFSTHKNNFLGITENSTINWITINKKGPNFQFNRIGFSFQNKKIIFYFETDFFISFLKVSILGLNIGIDILNLKNFNIGLNGLGIFYTSPTFSLGGSFEAVEKNYYKGSLIISFAKLMISALGIYQKTDDNQDHIFVYASIFYPLGGPPCFFITGLTIGIGIKYHLQIPDLKNISDFPLLKIMEKKEVSDPQNILKKLDSYLTCNKNEYFFSMGMKITSFGIIKTNLLLNINLKPKLKIVLLGNSQLNFPEKNGIVHATLNFIATYDDVEGALKIIAGLQADSYILDKNCVLSGNFAVYVWVKGKHSSDFIITIGGYHPIFEKKRENKYPHYPSITRVGINWIVDKHLAIKGNGYFALTPSCIMAGGNLSITFQDGNLKAWLIAYVDLLLQWKPWCYDITLGITIGASYCLKTWIGEKTFKVELGAHLHIWGPEFQGKAKINWTIISFTIYFGKANNIQKEINFSDVESLITSTSQNSPMDICQIQIIKGLEKKLNENYYLVYNDGLNFQIHTSIPASKIVLKLNDQSEIFQTNKNLYVLPMGESIILSSVLYITIKGPVSLHYEAIYENAAYALWGEKKLLNPEAELISDVLTGINFNAGIEVSKETLPVEGEYCINILNGLQKIHIKSYNLNIPNIEKGRKYSYEEEKFENIQFCYSKKNEYKETLIRNFQLDKELTKPLLENNDFYHCHIQFKETSKDN